MTDNQDTSIQTSVETQIKEIFASIPLVEKIHINRGHQKEINIRGLNNRALITPYIFSTEEFEGEIPEITQSDKILLVSLDLTEDGVKDVLSGIPHSLIDRMFMEGTLLILIARLGLLPLCLMVILK